MTELLACSASYDVGFKKRNGPMKQKPLLRGRLCVGGVGVTLAEWAAPGNRSRVSSCIINTLLVA